MKSSELLRILLADGWYRFKEQPGSHCLLMHPTKKALTRTGGIPFSFHGSGEVGRGLEQKILKLAGLR